MNDYTEDYEGPDEAVALTVDDLLPEAGVADTTDLSDDFASGAEDETETDDMDGANAAFEGNGL